MIEPDSTFSVGLLLATFGALITAVEGADVIRGLRARRWPTVEGRIHASTVRRDPYAGDKLVFYNAAVEYDYVVAGNRHRGSRITFAQSLANTESGARLQAMSEFARGARVRVWYDPADPARAVLRPGVSGGQWLLVGSGVGMLGSGLALLILAIG